MRKYSFSQIELYSIILFSAIVAALSVLVGFNLAWQHSGAQTPIVGAHELVATEVVSENVAPEKRVVGVSGTSQVLTGEVPESLEGKGISEIPVDGPSISDNAQVLASSDVVKHEAQDEGEAFGAIAFQEVLAHDSFAIQIGAFSEKQRALKLAHDQRSEHDTLSVVVRHVDGHKYFSVLVGDFDSKAQATQLKTRLQHKRGWQGYVIKRETDAQEVKLSS